MTLERMVKEMESNTDDGNWTKLIQSNKKNLTFKQFVKKFKENSKKNNKAHILPYMKDSYYKALYEKSDYSKGQTKPKINLEDDYFITREKVKIKRMTVTRGKKTYERTFAKRWQPSTKIPLIMASQLKPRSPEYRRYVTNLVESTGRSRQAVIKKIYRTRTKK